MEFGTDVLDESWYDGKTAGDDSNGKLGRAPQTESTELLIFVRGFDKPPSGVSAHNRRQTSPRPHQKGGKAADVVDDLQKPEGKDA